MAATWRKDCQRQNFGTDAGSFSGGPVKIVLHSTETGTWPAYANGAVAPHETWKWNGKTFDKRQHVSHAKAAMALKNLSGGVQTNRDSAHQIEIVGSCDIGFAAKYKYNYLPVMGDNFLRELGKEIRQLAKDIDCPLTVVKEWVSYPSSYGFKARQRMTLGEWDAFSGICGHQHVVENDHGDPGSLDVARALKLSGKVEVIDKPVPVTPKPVSVISKLLGKAPKFPLRTGHYFGPKDGPAESHSGYFGADDRAGLRQWQTQIRKRGYPVTVDGLYGAETAQVCKRFQQYAGLPVDGRIGPLTWARAWGAK